MDHTRAKIRQFIIDNFLFGDADLMVLDTDSLLKNGIIHSTGVLDILLFVEETFNLTIQDDEVIPDNFDSVARLAAFAEKKTGAVAV